MYLLNTKHVLDIETPAVIGLALHSRYKSYILQFVQIWKLYHGKFSLKMAENSNQSSAQYNDVDASPALFRDDRSPHSSRAKL